MSNEHVYHTTGQGRPICRLPAEVREAEVFSTLAGQPVTFDLTHTRYLSSEAVSGLIRAVNSCPEVRLCLEPESQPHVKIRQLFGHLVRQDPARAEEWVFQKPGCLCRLRPCCRARKR
jgi:hypothetical protein